MMGKSRRVLIGVIGGESCSAEEAQLAEEVGAELARHGAVLICGGRGGVMEAACRGAQREGGLTLGVLPGSDPAEANPYVTIALPTGLGSARNYVIVTAAAALIAIGGEYGTLSEIGFALRRGKRVVGLKSWDIPGMVRAWTPQEAVARALESVSEVKSERSG